MNTRLQRGFTIIELITIIVIIAVLAGIVIIGYSSVQAGAREQAVISDVDGVESELARYAAKHAGAYDTVLNWDSSAGSNSNIIFTPSNGNVIKVSGNGTSYCIRGYNPLAKTSKTLATAFKKGDCVTRWTDISAGYNMTCALSTDGLVYCWGWAMNVGALGNNVMNTNVGVPTPITTTGALSGKTVKALSTGNTHTCVIASDNLPYCWGANAAGQLGNNSTSDSAVPVAVTTSGVLSGKTVKAIASGGSHTCVIASDNLPYCWGQNTMNALGNNSSVNSSVPVAVTTSGALAGKTISSITAGDRHTCVVASDSKAYCWGQNGYGNLGTNNYTTSAVPIAVYTTGVLSGKNIASMSAGGVSACALTTDAVAACWGGASDQGQTGSGTPYGVIAPAAVDTSGVLSGKTVSSISSMGGISSHSCAVTSNGGIYCWGWNPYGQLGNNSTANGPSPVAVVTSGALSGKVMQKATTGNYHTCAIDTAGAAYCWGYGAFGVLGNNTMSVSGDSSVPVAVSTIDL